MEPWRPEPGAGPDPDRPVETLPLLAEEAVTRDRMIHPPKDLREKETKGIREHPLPCGNLNIFGRDVALSPWVG
jgi:hypothetical protein